MALPERPPEPQAGRCMMCWDIAAEGWANRVRLLQPAPQGRNRPRSDQFDAEIDGVVVLRSVGLAEVMDHLRRHVIPRQMTRMQQYRADQENEAVAGDVRRD